MQPPTAQLLHWAVVVLALLRERPMHPYEMRRLIKLRRKDDRLVLKPSSLYNAVIWLLEHELIEVHGRNREGRRPLRTTYALLPAGERELQRWLGAMLVEVRRDVSSFTVGLDHLLYLSPEDAVTYLERRRAALRDLIRAHEAGLPDLMHRIGRVHVIEVEHDVAIYRAQDTWLARLVEDVKSGALRWDTDAVLATARRAARGEDSPP